MTFTSIGLTVMVVLLRVPDVPPRTTTTHLVARRTALHYRNCSSQHDTARSRITRDRYNSPNMSNTCAAQSQNYAFPFPLQTIAVGTSSVRRFDERAKRTYLRVTRRRLAVSSKQSHTVRRPSVHVNSERDNWNRR